MAISAFGVDHGPVAKALTGTRGDKRNTKYLGAGLVGSQVGMRAGYRAGGTSYGQVSARETARSKEVMAGRKTVGAAIQETAKAPGFKAGGIGQAVGTAAAVGGYAAYRHHKNRGVK